MKLNKKSHKGNLKVTISKRLKTIIWDDRIGLDVGTIECPCCGHNTISQSEFHCGHIKSDADGGNLERTNLVPICSQCNLSMGTTNMTVFMQQQFDRNLNDILKNYQSYKLLTSSIFKIIKTKKTKKRLLNSLYKIIDSRKLVNF